jgi:hypothetical protein
MWDWDLTRTIAASSGVVALISLWFSVLNRRLALSQEARKQPKLLLETISSLQFQTDQSLVFALRLQVTNGSDNGNSIVGSELVINLPKTWNAPRLRIGADQSLSTITEDIGESLKLPANIAAHGAIGGWLLFPISKAFTDGKDLESFDLVVQDGKQSVHVLKSILFVRENR